MKHTPNKRMLVAYIILLAFLVTAVLVEAGWLGSNWNLTSDETLTGPSADHWFGTNRLGQDIFDRAVYSVRSALILGLVVALITTFTGAMLGVVAAYYHRRWPDAVIQWLASVLDAIPSYLFIIAMAAVLGASLAAMIITMSLLFWITTARLIRAEALRLGAMTFISSARVMGFGSVRTMALHILPNTMPILLFQALMTFVSAIKAEVVLSFLGLRKPEQGISWGSMIAESSSEIGIGFYANFLAASGLLFLLILALHILTEALQQALDPRMDQPS